jgi:plasmid stabilization system protein ParE
MANESLSVVFTESALRDLEDIVDFWTTNGEPERGLKYAHDLPREAIRCLSDLRTASEGRLLRKTNFPHVREHPVFKRTYRILYTLNECGRVVEILRFWHSHRDEPDSM